MARSIILALLVSSVSCSSNGSLKEISGGPASKPGFSLPDAGSSTPPSGIAGSGDPIGANGGTGALPSDNGGAGGSPPAPEDAQAPAPEPMPLPPPPIPDAAANGTFINTVFIVVEAGANWHGVPSAMPYLASLVATGAHSEQYYNPPGLHPNELNYLWLEAGSQLGVSNSDNPADTLIRGANHLTKLLDAAGVSWTSYQEDISSGVCPVADQAQYVTRHNPFVFFDDLVGDPASPGSSHCIEHHKPLSQFLPDLKAGKVARYNFIGPNLLHDLENGDEVQADAWLRANVDPIRNPASPDHNPAIWAHSALFLVWDAGDPPSDGPIGLVISSPFAKPGYQDTTSPAPYHYTHSSLLRTVQEVLGVAGTPLGDAASARNLSEFFSRYP